MEKLELKHLAPYLPYGVIINCDFKDGDILPCELEGLTTDEAFLNGADWNYKENSDFKPILRPLSDLTKYIDGVGVPMLEILKINGKPNRKIDRCKFDGSFIREPQYNATEVTKESWEISETIFYPSLKVKTYEWLLKYHFDVFGLIEKGLAIDINTLSQ